jgi:acetylornithine aminotransferase
LIWYPGHDLLLNDIVRADNCCLYDEEGNRYIDLESGVWCTSIGHGHPGVARAIADQIGRIAHTGFNYSNPVVEETARRFLALPGFEGGRCVFLCSGSEAVEYGVRTAQAIVDKPLLMTMADSYFGAYGSASNRRQDEWYCHDWAVCVERGCGERCEHWDAIPFDRIGGFLFEPGSSSGLVRFPPRRLVQRVVDEIRAGGGLVLVNEVTTGVGRTGEWFGYQHYDISPDIVAVGKGIGNGYPVSITAFAPGVVERLGGEPLKYAQSHQNDPLGAAVAREVIGTIEDERLIERGRAIAAALSGGLRDIQDRTDRVKEVRSRGLMVGVEMNDDRASAFTARTHVELVRRGYIVGRRPGVNVFRIDPSLTIEREHIEGFLEAFDHILAGTKR